MGLFKPWNKKDKWPKMNVMQQAEAVNRVNNQKDLLEMFYAAGTHPVVKEHLVKAILDHGELVKIANGPGDTTVRCIALTRVNDERVILNLLQESDSVIRLNAALRLTDFDSEAARAKLQEMAGWDGTPEIQAIAALAVRDLPMLNTLKVLHHSNAAEVAKEIMGTK